LLRKTDTCAVYINKNQMLLMWLWFF